MAQKPQIHRIVNLVVDAQFGTDPAFIEQARRSADALRARGIPTIWISMNNRSQLFEPTKTWPSASPQMRSIEELEQGGFFGHDPKNTSEQELQAFREHFARFGPRIDEAMYPKAFFDAFATPESIKQPGARQHYLEQQRDEHIGGIDNVFRRTGSSDHLTLLDYLKSMGVEQVTIMGGNADVCVTETAMGAARNGIRATILSDHIIRHTDQAGTNPPEQYENELRVLHDQTLDRPYELANYPTKSALSAGTMYSGTDKAAIKKNLRIETFDDFLWSAPDPFPDTVVKPFIDEARRVAPDLSEHPVKTSSSEPKFSLEDSKKLIVSALNAFDTDLGKKAEEILNDPARWRLTEVPSGQARIMRSLPAGSRQTKNNPANTNPYAVIEYEFDGTTNGVIYMAHEVGHAIADDYMRKAGYTYRDNPNHLAETQAYFVQHVIYDHLAHSQDTEIATAAKQHFTSTMTEYLRPVANADASMHGRPMSILAASGVFNLAKAQDEQSRRRTIETLLGLGPQDPKSITAVLATAGVTNQTDMALMANETIRNATGHSSGIAVTEQQQQQRQHLPTERDRAQQEQWQADQQQRQTARRVRKDYSVLDEATDPSRPSGATVKANSATPT